VARLREQYEKEVGPALQKEFGFKNRMEVPKLVKIVVNAGVGEAIQNAKILDGAMDALGAITGQKPKLNRARLSVAAFKLSVAR
jgi:large subunit ribosomal protein L5